MLNKLITKVRRTSDCIASFISNRIVYLNVEEKKMVAACIKDIIYISIAFVIFMILVFTPYFLTTN